MSESLIALLIGVFTGFLSGLMGIGGGAIGTPLIRLLLDAPPVIALATTMPVIFPSGLSGSIAYYRERMIDFSLAGLVLITALPMTWIGATVSHQMEGRILMLLTAVFLLVVGSSFLVRSYLFAGAGDHSPKHSIPLSLAAGVLGGFLAGLLAIGGGVIYVPIFVRLFRRPMKTALATSLFVVMLVAIPGSIRHAQLQHIDWEIAGYVSLGVLPASFLGARYALTLRNTTLERLFGILTILFGVYFFFSQL